MSKSAGDGRNAVALVSAPGASMVTTQALAANVEGLMRGLSGDLAWRSPLRVGDGVANTRQQADARWR